MNADLFQKRARQQNSRTQALWLDPSWETNPDSTTLLWTCQTCEGPSLPPPWLVRTNENCAAGKPTDHKERQGHDRCWSGKAWGLCPPVPCRALAPRQETQARDTDTDTRQRHTDLNQNVRASMKIRNSRQRKCSHATSEVWEKRQSEDLGRQEHGRGRHLCISTSIHL